MNQLVCPRSQQAGPLDWQLIHEVDAVDGLLDQEAARRKEEVRRQSLQRSLQTQVAEAHKARAEEREDQRRWGARLQDDVERHKGEERQRRVDNREALRSFNAEREELLELKHRRNREEAEKDRRAAAAVVAEGAEASAREIAAAKAKKEKEKEILLQVNADCKKACAEKAERKRQEVREDIRLMGEMDAMQAAQEKERSRKFEEFKAKAKGRPTGGGGPCPSREELAAAQREQEERDWWFRDKKWRREQRGLTEKQEQLRQMAMEGAMAIQMQVQEKAARQVLLRESEAKLAEQMRRDTAALKTEAKQAQEAKRSLAKGNQEYLKMQMAQDSLAPGKFGHDSMNVTEKGLNRSLLDRADDEKLRFIFKRKQKEFHMPKMR